MRNGLGGVLVPVTTPFEPSTGEISPVRFRENLRRWLEHPLDGIVLFGSTGEGVLLDEEEKVRLVGFARDLVPPLVSLVAGAGADSTRETARQARRLADAGVESVLVHPPPYFGGSLAPAELRDHYLAVAEASPIPVIIYHIPKYTHVVLEAGLIAELARHPNIAAVKDSSGDLKRLAEYGEICGEHCRLLVGNGSLLYTALELGAAGGIVAVGLLAPAECARILQHYRDGKSREAGELQERIAPAHREIVARYGARGVKVALELLGYHGGPPRPPLRSLGRREREQVGRVLEAAGLMRK